jgi:hypothetical protein
VAASAACALVFGWATAVRGLAHGLLDSLPIAGVALVATLASASASASARRRAREAASSAVTLALMTAAAAAVHLSGGLIEAHFLFFVAGRRVPDVGAVADRGRLRRRPPRCPGRTSEDHEHTSAGKGPLTCENADEPSKSRVTTARLNTSPASGSTA